MVKFSNPSRPDATDLKREEKKTMVFLTNAVSILEDAKEELAERLRAIEGGTEIMERLAEDGLKLLNDIRETIPERQRANLYNVGMDMEMRMTPKYTPLKHCMVIQKEDFRELVDAAQEKCKSCILDNDECAKCKLYQLLIVVLPLDKYDGTFLCPYNMASWGN